MNNQSASGYASQKRKRNIQNEIELGRLAPQATDIEAVILGAAVMENQIIDDILSIITTPEAFYKESHRLIFEVIMSMYEAGRRIDMGTIGDELKKLGKLDDVGGIYFIATLINDVATTAHIDEYCRIVMEKHIKRELIKFHGENVMQAYDDSSDAFDMIEKSSSFLVEITDKAVKKQYLNLNQSISEVLNFTTQLRNEEVKLNGVTTGHPALNKVTGGWKNSDLIILAARPSVGKTAFILNLTLSAATDIEKPTPVGIFSLEMNHKQLTERLLANVSGIELDKIRNGNLADHEFEQLLQHASQAARLPIYIDDSASLTTVELRAKARRMKKVHGVGLIIIDYLQLMSGAGRTGMTREQEISKISRELKLLAKSIDIPVIALSQLNRAVEGRSDNQPKLSDLRDSGSIEQDADMVIFLYGHPKDIIKENPNLKNERNIDIAKFRNGTLQSFICDFDGAHQRFFNMERSIFSQREQSIDFNPVKPSPHVFGSAFEMPAKITIDYSAPKHLQSPNEPF